MTDRSKTLEVMARATRADLYEEAEAPENTNPTMQAYYKAIIDKHERLMDCALTAYESHLQAEGMAVVPRRALEQIVNLSDCGFAVDVAEQALAAALPPSKE